MDKLDKYLVELSDRLDREGKSACADAIDELFKTSSLKKVAQYVGVIGYVLKQERAMSNCIRKKRADSSSEPMQEIVLGCLKEYQDGQDYHNTEWTSKYAQAIKDSPDKFDTSHLLFLSSVGANSDIASHIERVQKTADILKDNGVEDDTLTTILSHIDTFGNILQKETENCPFKVAAPRSPRSSWSRLTSPSEFKWWNPMSWSSEGRERGEDEDVLKHMDDVNTHLTHIEYLMYQAEQAGNAFKTTYENEVRQHTAQMRDLIYALREYSAVVGIDQGIPPTAYLNAFSQALDTLDQAPLNKNVYYDYVSKSYSQLRQRMWTFVESTSQDGTEQQRIDDFVENMRGHEPDQPPVIPSPQQAQQPITEEQQPATQTNVPGIQDWQAGGAAKFIRDKVPTTISDDVIKTILQAIAESGASGEMKDKTYQIMEELGAGNAPPETPRSALPAESTPAKPSQPAPTKPPVAKVPTSKNPASADRKRFRRPAPGLEGPQVSASRIIASQQASSKKVSVFDMICIADVLDQVDQQWAEILDKYIKEQDEIMVELPEFPKFSAPLKEKGH